MRRFIVYPALLCCLGLLTSLVAWFFWISLVCITLPSLAHGQDSTVESGNVAKITLPSQPFGWFVFRSAVGAIDLEEYIAKNPNISGWVLRDRWSSIQPTREATYDFRRLAAAAAKSGLQNKYWQLEVFGGVSAPTWTGGYEAQFTESYVSHYERLVAAMGEQFAKDPWLVAVHCTLPMHESPEFVLQSSLNKPGWQQRALNANARALSALGRAFPRQTIVIDLHNPLNAQDNYCRLQVAQATKLLGKRLALQENAWNAKADQVNYNLYQMVKAHSAAGNPAGLEQVTASSNVRYGGTLPTSVKYLMAANVQYGIIYEPDVPNIGPFPKKR